MTQITPQITISELLQNFPQLEDKLIEIVPVFIKLKNPVLKRTIAKITSLRQASLIGNIQLSDLVNRLRAEVGQTELVLEGSSKPSRETVPEEILIKTPATVYDAREDIEKGIHPLAKVMKDVSILEPGQIYKLITSFIPAPLIAMLKEKSCKVWTRGSGELIETYIIKN